MTVKNLLALFLIFFKIAFSVFILLTSATPALACPPTFIPHSSSLIPHSSSLIPSKMMGKITFRVDMRNETVAPEGVFFASSFLFTIGLSNWTFQPMCDLGNGIWEVSFVNVPPGMYQYKFVNGNAPPAGWEFQTFGGPCTNALDNNNRFLTVTGGMQMIGPFCFETCDVFCSGLGDPGGDDTMPPEITGDIPSDVTLNCGDDLPDPEPLTADDGCDINATTTTGMPTETIANGACNSQIITRTWSVTDCSGNTATASQVITFQDLTPPIIIGNAPANTTAQCGNLPPAAPLSATDACDLSITTTGLPTTIFNGGGGPCGSGTATRTWKVMDCAGNMAQKTQIITLTDAVPPVIIANLPANITVACGSLPTGFSLAATDACDMTLTGTALPVDNISGLNNCGTGQIIRTWTATDCTGNTATKSQTITVTDFDLPIITEIVPGNLVINCGQNVPTALPLAASDNCTPNITALPTDNISGLNNCGLGQIIRTWQATDCSGNSRTTSQIIVILDNLPPFITAPAPAAITINCGQNLPTGAPLPATDGCTQNLTATPTDNFSNLNNCGLGQVIRTWTATDCAGNSRTTSQIITIIDTAPPVLTVPQNISVECSNIPAAQPTAATATDGCTASPTILYKGETMVFLGCPYQIHRTWQATDCSGNTAAATQIITVFDTQPPVFSGVPADITICAGGNLPMIALNWTDNCAGNGISNGTDATAGNVITRTWTATDACGNLATAVQKITIGSPPAAPAGLDQILTCENPTAILGNVPPPPGLAFLWSGPGINISNQNDPNPSVNLTGNYMLTVTEQISGSGCTATATVNISENKTAPTADAGAAKTLTCIVNSVILDGAGSPGSTFFWSGAGINFSNQNQQNPSVTEPGTYFLTTSNPSNGCTATDSTTVSVDGNLPIADAGNDAVLTCLVNSVLLNGQNSSSGAGINYEWTDAAGVVLGNNLTQNVAQKGIYKLTVFNSNSGCSSSSTVEVLENKTPPKADAGADFELTCEKTSVILGGASSMGTNFSYLWYDALPLGLLPTLAVSTPGHYHFSVLDLTNGCQAFDSVLVTENKTPPKAAAGADLTLTCSATSVNLDGSASDVGANFGYVWTGQNFNSTNQNPTVSTPGIYILTVKNTATGCTATDAVEVFADANLPTADAGAGGILTCTTTQILLDGQNSTPGGLDFEWKNAAGAVVGTGVSVFVNVPGTFILTVSNPATGCKNFDEVVILQDTAAPIAVAGADVQFTCSQTSLVLDGKNSQPTGANLDFLWSGAGIVGNPNSVAVSINQPGQYILKVTNLVNGCTATDAVLASQNPDVPTADAGQNQTLTCQISTLILLGSSSVADASFLWTGPGINISNQNLQNPTVDLPGNYALVATDPATGCASPAATVEVLDGRILPDLTVAAAGNLDCVTSSVLISSQNNLPTGSPIFQWFFQNQPISGATSSTFLAENPGQYFLQITNPANGCTNSATATILENATGLPIKIEGGGMPNCKNPIVTLTENTASQLPNVQLTWTTVGGNISQNPTANSIELDAAGLYILLATDPVNGCQSRDTVEIFADFQKPSVQFDQIFELECGSPSVNLSANVVSPTTDLTFLWSGAGGFSSAEISPAVGQPGIFNLTVTQNTNGCTASASTEVLAGSEIEGVFFTATSPDCTSGGSGFLKIDSVVGANLPFDFSLDGVVFQPDSVFKMLVAGDYILTVLDGSGCSTTRNFSIENVPSFSVWFVKNLQINWGDSVQLEPVNLSSAAAFFSWSDSTSLSCSNCEKPFASPTETTTYTLTVTNAEGCTATAEITVSVVVDLKIFTPNILSRKGDFPNDRLTVFAGQQVRSVKKMEVFSRWGDLVFLKENFPPNSPDEGWDGQFRGKFVDVGVYVFYAKLELADGREILERGEVLVVE